MNSSLFFHLLRFERKEINFFPLLIESFSGWPRLAGSGDRPDGEGEVEDPREAAQVFLEEAQCGGPDEEGHHEE